MQLQDDSGMVDYNLALVIFRTGGQLDGHYFVAAPTPASAWVVFDDKNVLMPMSLRDLQGNYGKAVHGVMYVRKTAPAEDDWARLIPTACLGTDAPRQVSPPLPSPPLPFHPPFAEQLMSYFHSSLSLDKTSWIAETDTLLVLSTI